MDHSDNNNNNHNNNNNDGIEMNLHPSSSFIEINQHHSKDSSVNPNHADIPKTHSFPDYRPDLAEDEDDGGGGGYAHTKQYYLGSRHSKGKKKGRVKNEIETSIHQRKNMTLVNSPKIRYQEDKDDATNTEVVVQDNDQNNHNQLLDDNRHNDVQHEEDEEDEYAKFDERINMYDDENFSKNDPRVEDDFHSYFDELAEAARNIQDPTIILPSKRHEILQQTTVENLELQKKRGLFIPWKSSVQGIATRIFSCCVPDRWRKWVEEKTERRKKESELNLMKMPKYDKMSYEEKKDLQSFLIDLGYALSTYGCPSHRIEYHLSVISTFFGLEGYYFATPTGIFFSFSSITSKSVSDSTVHFVRVNSYTIDLSKLCLLDDVADDLVRGKYKSITEAQSQIEKVILHPGINRFMEAFSIFFCSAFFAAILDGSWLEIMAAFFAGSGVALLLLLSKRVPVLAKAFTVTATFLACIIGTTVKSIAYLIATSTNAPSSAFISQRVNVFLVALSGVIALVPGLTFTVAVSELASWHLLAGCAKLLEGTMTVLQIGFGLLIGYQASNIIHIPVQNFDTQPFPLWGVSIIAFFLIIAFMIMLNTPRYPFLIFTIIISSFSGFFTSYLITFYIGDMGEIMGSFTGSMIIGIFGNVFARISNHIPDVSNTCAIIMLVPGSVGVRGINSFIERDIVAGLNFTFKMLMIALALAFGLLVSTFLFPPKKKL